MIEKLKEYAPIATVVIAIVAIGGLLLSFLAHKRMERSLEVQFRPILDLERPRYEIKGQGPTRAFKARFDLINFGKTPAHEFRRSNNKVLFVIKDRDLFLSVKSQAEFDERYFFYIKGIMKLFLEYFTNNPTASLDDVKNHFSDLKKNPDSVDDKYIKSKEGKLAFKVGGYPDVDMWTRPPTMLSPGSRTPFSIGRSSGEEVQQKVDSGENMIVVFVGLEYEGIKLGKKFSYYYLGYYDGGLHPTGTNRYPRGLIPFKEWSTRDQL